MKIVPILILSGLCIHSWGQNSKLETHNPIPRQGDEIQVEFSVDKLKLSDLRDKEKKTKEDYNKLWDNNIGKGSFKINQIVADTGKVNIGPFSFTVDDTTYVTNILTLKVLPKLPGNIKEGIWIRYTEIAGLGHLIIEQRVSRGPQKKTDSQGTSVSLDNGGITFTELDQEKFERFGLKITYNSSNSSMQTVDNVDGDLFSGFVNYHELTYTFEKLTDFKGRLMIDKGLFLNFPKSGFVEILAVKN